MSYILLIIDVQPEFQDSYDTAVLSACKRALRQARKDKAGVVFVEYNGGGDTEYELVKEVQGYKKVFWVEKWTDDGSIEVKNAIDHYKLNEKYIKVCGVNTDACVRDTVCGLSELYPSSSITVLSDACGSCHDHWSGLDEMSMLRNVKVK